MIKNYNSAQEILAGKSKDELIEIWNETERQFRFTLESTALKDRNLKLDAIINVRTWLMDIMIDKMPTAEFVKVIGA